MLRYLYADQLSTCPMLARTMFEDRAHQFKNRLNWAVTVDETGAERDEYDSLNPLYVLWQEADGRHGGSLRFLPTTGDTMVNDHFAHLTNGMRIESPFIWECTRFCLSPDASPQVAARLMLGGLEVGLAQNLHQAVGVFDARMVRIYRRLGWSPTVLGQDGTGSDAISVGLWDFDPAYRAVLLRRSGLSSDIVRHWARRSTVFPTAA